MFPTSGFRIAYDMLRDNHAQKVADKMSVQILEIAARAAFNLATGRTPWPMRCGI